MCVYMCVVCACVNMYVCVHVWGVCVSCVVCVYMCVVCVTCVVCVRVHSV